jgi:hypothetical protein
MIQVNLLPPEYSPRSGTPVARFAAVVIGLVAVLSAGGVYAYTHFIELANTRDVRDTRQGEAVAKERLRDVSLSLQKEIDVYVKRRVAVQTINRSRTLWSRKLDQFFDIVTSHGREHQLVAWLENLTVPRVVAGQGGARRGRGRKGAKEPQSAGKLECTGYLAMDDDTDALRVMAAFHTAITGGPDGPATSFFGDFQHINNPNIAIQRGSGDKDLIPPYKGSFKLDLMLNPIQLDAKAPSSQDEQLAEIEAALFDEDFSFSDRDE